MCLCAGVCKPEHANNYTFPLWSPIPAKANMVVSVAATTLLHIPQINRRLTYIDRILEKDYFVKPFVSFLKLSHFKSFVVSSYMELD